MQLVRRQLTLPVRVVIRVRRVGRVRSVQKRSVLQRSEHFILLNPSNPSNPSHSYNNSNKQLYCCPTTKCLTAKRNTTLKTPSVTQRLADLLSLACTPPSLAAAPAKLGALLRENDLPWYSDSGRGKSLCGTVAYATCETVADATSDSCCKG